MNVHTPGKWLLGCLAFLCLLPAAFASSHREAPLIANDPLADNTDVYAFRSPDDQNTVTLIANYVPLQLPQGGPNYYQFGENVRYEIHVDNDVNTPGDDIIYRFTFSLTNEDPTTFFNIRLGQENLKTSYQMERSMDGGQSFQTIISNGTVPPPNIGARSINSPLGVPQDYNSLITSAIETTAQGEKVFCGPADDPFFVDLGGIFDLGDAPRQNGTPKDGVACLNVSTIAIQVPIHLLQKDGKGVHQANDILDGDFVIGVWASASRPAMRTLDPLGASPAYSGNWVQVSRLGMPLTNEAVIPIGAKDAWNARTPYNEDPAHFEYFYNPELALYMDDAQFGGAVPAFAPLRIQRNSLGAFDFGNGNDGLYGLKGSPAVAGTALDDAVFGTLLLPAPGKPRSVDLWPTFHTGVPNVRPYQLATGKNGDPLAAGKPFVNNFLPNGGDMLRLNMATPVTDRNDPAFSALGLVQAAVLGLTDPVYNCTSALQAIPNMDGFPNGRRLEDDVTRIELQAVSGVVLAAIGLWYDDFDPTAPNASPVTQDLLDVLTYSTGVDANDTTFKTSFPYVQTPWAGDGKCGGIPVFYQQPTVLTPTGQAVAPTNLMADNSKAFIVPLSWQDNSTNEEGFIIYRNSPSNGAEILDTVMANTTSYTDTVLIFGETLSYTVTAFVNTTESAPTNVATYSQPAAFQQMWVRFVCYNPQTDSITWRVTNPNDQALCYIYAQWWSPQRDTLFALPGETFFKTKNNPQDPNTYGDDNITGIWWADHRLLPGRPYNLVRNIPLGTSCGTVRRAPGQNSPRAGQVFTAGSPLARLIRAEDIEHQFMQESVMISPNPFASTITLEALEVQDQLKVKVLTIAGQLLMEKTVDFTDRMQLDLSKLAAGMYVLEIETEKTSISRQIVKK